MGNEQKRELHDLNTMREKMMECEEKISMEISNLFNVLVDGMQKLGKSNEASKHFAIDELIEILKCKIDEYRFKK